MSRSIVAPPALLIAWASVVMGTGTLALAQQPKLWVVIEADTNSQDIAGDMRKNLEIIREMLRWNIGNKRLEILPPSANFTRASIQGKLDRIEKTMNGDDSVLFYYSGHGYYEEQRGTYFDAPGDQSRIYLSGIRKSVMKLEPRLGVIIIDCCNKVQGRGPALPAPQPPAPPEGATPLFDGLFFQSRGEVVINSSATNEYAFTQGRFIDDEFNHARIYLGSLFTRQLQSVCLENGRMVRWPTLVRELKNQVDRAFREEYPNGVEMNRTVQNTQHVVGIVNNRYVQ